MHLVAHTHHSHDSTTTKWKKLTNEHPNGFIACQVNMGLHRQCIIATYWYTARQYCPWFHNTSQFILMWFHTVCKINKAAPGKTGYQSCIKLQTLVEHAKKFSGIIITLLQLLENSIAGTKNHTQLLQYLHTKNHHSYGHQTVDDGDLVCNYSLAFFAYHGIKCTEDKDAIQKYLSTGRKWEITSVKALIFLCKTVPIAKDLHKLGTFVTYTIRSKRKISAPTFQCKFEVGKKKKTFSYWYSA